MCVCVCVCARARAIMPVACSRIQTKTSTRPQVFSAVPCSEGRGYPHGAKLEFRAPADDGGMPITAYEFASSSDGGSTWTSHGTVLADSLTPDEFGRLEHELAGLENGKAYHLGVVAVNFYGAGPRVALGPYTPTDCPHLEQVCVCARACLRMYSCMYIYMYMYEYTYIFKHTHA